MAKPQKALKNDVSAGTQGRLRDELPFRLFDVPSNSALLQVHPVVTAPATRRPGNCKRTQPKHTATCRAVAPQPYRQKGTWPRPQGSTRAPAVHRRRCRAPVTPPQPRDYSQRTPKKDASI